MNNTSGGWLTQVLGFRPLQHPEAKKNRNVNNKYLSAAWTLPLLFTLNLHISNMIGRLSTPSQLHPSLFLFKRQVCEHMSLQSMSFIWERIPHVENIPVDMNHIISKDLSAARSCCQAPVLPHPNAGPLDSHVMTGEVTELTGHVH